MICTKCKEPKDDSEFPLLSNRTDGRRDTKCKTCRSAVALEWYYQNKERAKQNHLRWKADNPEKVIAHYLAAEQRRRDAKMV